MLSSLKTYLLGTPTLSQATGFLRQIFVFSFGLQLFVAFCVTLLLLTMVSSKSQSALFAQIMLGLSVLQLPITLLFGHLMGKPTTRQAYLSACIMLGVLLSTPGWFGAMAFLSTNKRFYLVIFLFILIAYYCLGLLLCGRFGKEASQLSPAEANKTHEK